MYQPDKPIFRPTQYAEHQLVASILDDSYPPGSALPGERDLAGQMNVTRQTLREALQRLAKDRWITIRHGKPTIVNDYWAEGGLGILNTLVNFTDHLPREFITHLLRTRAIFMPACAVTAVPDRAPVFLKHLGSAATLAENADEYADFDWALQFLMARHSGNMIYPLILNDFAPVFKALARGYFSLKKGRAASARYYAGLTRAIRKKSGIETIVREAMEESIEIWEQFQNNQRDAAS